MSQNRKASRPGSALDRRAALGLGLMSASALILGGTARAAAHKGVKITVLYGQPKNPAEFEKYYLETHMPMVYKVKGIKHIELAVCLPGPGSSAPAFYRITELWFASQKQMEKVTGTPAWKQIVDDVPKFASGGASVLVSRIE